MPATGRRVTSANKKVPCQSFDGRDSVSSKRLFCEAILKNWARKLTRSSSVPIRNGSLFGDFEPSTTILTCQRKLAPVENHNRESDIDQIEIPSSDTKATV